jgi:hypothetical protein
MLQDRDRNVPVSYIHLLCKSNASLTVCVVLGVFQNAIYTAPGLAVFRSICVAHKHACRILISVFKNYWSRCFSFPVIFEINILKENVLVSPPPSQ